MSSILNSRVSLRKNFRTYQVPRANSCYTKLESRDYYYRETHIINSGAEKIKKIKTSYARSIPSAIRAKVAKNGTWELLKSLGRVYSYCVEAEENMYSYNKKGIDMLVETTPILKLTSNTSVHEFRSIAKYRNDVFQNIGGSVETFMRDVKSVYPDVKKMLRIPHLQEYCSNQFEDLKELKSTDEIDELIRKMCSKPSFYLHDIDPGLWNPTIKKGNDFDPHNIINLLHYLDGQGAGFTKWMFFIAFTGSLFPWHMEDAGLDAVSFLLWGAPKLWILIEEQKSIQKFEGAMRVLMDVTGCPRFLGEKIWITTLSFLKTHNVEYRLQLQFPGEYVFLEANVYHAVINLGFNYSLTCNCIFPSFLERLSKFEVVPACNCQPPLPASSKLVYQQVFHGNNCVPAQDLLTFSKSLLDGIIATNSRSMKNVANKESDRFAPKRKYTSGSCGICSRHFNKYSNCKRHIEKGSCHKKLK